jgi:uncharacterized repeat protein (TIGR01451 family)
MNETASPMGYSAPPTGLFSPQQIRAAYGINLISQEGSGQTIAIIGAFDDPDLVSSNLASYASSDLHNFDAYYGLPDFGGSGPTFTKLDQSGGTNYPIPQPGGGFNWTQEEAADVEWSHAIAPEANIVLIEASSANYNNLINTPSKNTGAVDTARNIAGVSVISMSFGQADGSSNYSYDNANVFTTPTTPTPHTGITFLAASGDLGAPGYYPASSPNVVAVGGTSLTLSGGNYTEVGWNGSGGGVSLFEWQSTYWQEPVIHNGYGTVAPAGDRAMPDVALDADPNTGMAIYDSYDGGSANPWWQYGGTSIATPCWAGMIAITDQIRVSAGLTTLDGPTQALPALYSLPSGDFHDITSGTSDGSPAYSVDFTPTTGSSYNLVTGLGSPIANLLVPDLALGPRADLTVAMSDSGSFSQGDIGDSYTITVGNSGSGPTDGSTVSLVDTLPAGLTATVMSGTGWTVNLATLTATRNDVLAAGSTYPPLTVTVNVAANAPASVTNTATVSGGGEVITSNDTGTDLTAIVSPHSMTWIGPANGDWNSSNWSNSPPSAPNALIDAVVNSAANVTVNAPQEANSLAISNGGQITIAAGASLSITGDVSLDSGAEISLAAGATLALSGLSTSVEPATLNIDGGTVLANGSFTSPVPIMLLAGGATLNTNGSDLTLGGPITGVNGLLKVGSGTLTLSGENAYSGATAIVAGRLVIANSAGLPTGGSMIVGSGLAFGATPAAVQQMAASGLISYVSAVQGKTSATVTANPRTIDSTSTVGGVASLSDTQPQASRFPAMAWNATAVASPNVCAELIIPHSERGASSRVHAVDDSPAANLFAQWANAQRWVGELPPAGVDAKLQTDYDSLRIRDFLLAAYAG